MMRKRLSVLASAAAMAAMAVLFTPGEASATGYVVWNAPCPEGRACVADFATNNMWVATSCWFSNMGNNGFSDKADYYYTHGNSIKLGNYNPYRNGPTWDKNSFDWSPTLPAWSQGFVPLKNTYDAMMVNC